MQINRESPVVAIAVVCALALAACAGSDSGSSDTAPSDTAPSDTAPSDTAPCEAAQDVKDAVAAGDGAATDEEISEAVDRFADALDDLADAVPDEIKSDVELLADGTRVLSEIEPGAEPTEEQQEILASEEYNAAGGRLDVYFEETCGLDL